MTSGDYYFSDENQNKLDNVYVDQYSFNNVTFSRNVTSVPVLNLLNEYAYICYKIGTDDSNDTKVFFNPDYLFLFMNGEKSFISGLNIYKSYILDEYKKIKKKFLIIIWTIVAIYCLFYIYIFFGSIYLNKKINSEIEKTIKYFFRIPVEILKNQIKNCNMYCKVNLNNKSDINHLILTPKIKIDSNNGVISQENENDSKINDSEESHLIINEIKLLDDKNNSMKTKLNIKEEKTRKIKLNKSHYTLILIEFIVTYFLFLLLASIYTINYNRASHYIIIFSDIVNLKNLYTALFNYIMLYIVEINF